MLSTTPVPSLDPVAILVGVADGLWEAVQGLSPQAIGVGVAMLTLRVGWFLFGDIVKKDTDYRKVVALYERANEEAEWGCYGQARNTWRQAERLHDRMDRKWAK